MSNKSCRSDNSRKRPHIHRFRTVARRICVRKFAQRTDTDASKSCHSGNSRKRFHIHRFRIAARRTRVCNPAGQCTCVRSCKLAPRHTSHTIRRNHHRHTLVLRNLVHTYRFPIPSSTCIHILCKSSPVGTNHKRPHNRLDRTAAHRKWVHTSASTRRPSTPQSTTPPHTVSQNAISFRSSFSSPVPFAQHNRFARCAKTTRFRTILPTCNQLLSPYHLSVVSLVYSMIKSRAS